MIIISDIFDRANSLIMNIMTRSVLIVSFFFFFEKKKETMNILLVIIFIIIILNQVNSLNVKLNTNSLKM